MDEPLSNLDAALRVHMRAELAELHRRLGRTFVYVTHDQAEALTMSSRVAVMKDGRILQIAPPAEVYAAPASVEVAEFVGSPAINLLAGERDAAGAVTLEGAPLRIRLGGGRPGPVTLGLRPEQLAPVSEARAGALAGTLRHAENLGADAFLHLDRQGAALIVRVDSAAAAGLAPGARVHVAIVKGRPLVFAPGGARIDAAPALEAA